MTATSRSTSGAEGSSGPSGKCARSDEDRLFEKSRRRILKMLEQGVTTIEIKSGYGLDLESEMKQLRVIARLAAGTPLDVVATFMGAHHKPPGGSDDDNYVGILIDEMMPAVAEAGLAKYIDVFCEKGVFDVEETRRILEAGKRYGFGLKVHSDEIYALGGTELAVEMGAASVEHLTKVTRYRDSRPVRKPDDSCASASRPRSDSPRSITRLPGR